MGYVKYREDDLKITESRLFMKGLLPLNSNKSAPAIPVYACYYCEKVFPSQDKLNEHIKNDHSIIDPVVTINCKIAHSENYVTSVHSVVIYNYNIPARITVNGTELPSSPENSHALDITDIIKTAIEENGSCLLQVGNESICVKLLSVETIRSDLVQGVIDRWEQAARDGGTIKNIYPTDINDAERRYLDGFFNYYVAATMNGGDSRKRYDDAFSLLNSFVTISNLGRVVLAVIAFRRNWLDTLLQLSAGHSDCFAQACRVLRTVDYEESFDANSNEDSGNGKELFVEDSLKDCLDAYAALYMGDRAAVDRYLNSINQPEEITDINGRDRIYLLLARRAQKDKDFRRAEYYLDQIQSPFMKKEGT